MPDLNLKNKTDFKVDSLINKYDNIIGSVEQYLPKTSKVYLIGEIHTQETHKLFINDILKNMQPKAFLYEGYEAGKKHNPNKLLTINDILEEFDLTFCREKFTAGVQAYLNQNSSLLNLKTVSVNEDFPHLHDLQKILDTSMWNFGYIAKEIINTVLIDIVRIETPVLREKIFKWDKHIKLKELDNPSMEEDIITFNSYISKCSNFYYSPWGLNYKLDDVVYLLEHSPMGKDIPKKEKFLILLPSTVENYIDEYKEKENNCILNVDLVYKEKAAIEDTLARLKIPAYGFDADDSVKVAAFNSGKAKKYNFIRERAMVMILEEHIKQNPSNSIITCTGSEHIRPNSELITTLKRTQTPFTCITLKNPDSRGSNPLESISHNIYLNNVFNSNK